MHLKLTNGELATTNAGDASVMGTHLEKVYRNHRLVDWSVLHNLPQRNFMLELDTLIYWKELKQAVKSCQMLNDLYSMMYLLMHSRQ